MKRLTVPVVVVLLCTMLFLTSIPVDAQNQGTWVGEYFNNMALSGSPVLVRADEAIDFTWGEAAPDPAITADHFSVRWSKADYFSGGIYRFTARSDDGIRIYIDNQLILDAWYDRAPVPAVIADAPINAGQHVIRVEYYENNGAATVSVSWQLSSTYATGPWIAEYYNNTNLLGPAAFQRTEQTIDRNWGLLSPLEGHVGADNFSVRWTGSPHFTTGTYRFSVHADDGVRMWIDNQLVLDAWYDSGFTPPYTAVLPLTEGTHAIRVEYYERTEAAAIRVEWTPIFGAYPIATPIPPIPTPAPQLPGGTTSGEWAVAYFNNAALSGTPIYNEAIAGLTLDLDWGNASPAYVVPTDTFSARLTRQIQFPGGSVRFAVRADDGIRLYIDGALLLDEWRESSGDYFFIDYGPSQGEHTVTLEFYEATRLASLQFYWIYPRATHPETGVVVQINTNLLNIRSGPGVAYPILDRVPRDSVFAVTGRSADDSRWVRINLNSVEGWLNSTYALLLGDQANVPLVSSEEAAATRSSGTPTGMQVLVTGNLNIRSGPGIEYARVGVLPIGSTADVVGRNADGTWWEINLAVGKGWVSRLYLQQIGGLETNVPITG